MTQRIHRWTLPHPRQTEREILAGALVMAVYLAILVAVMVLR